VWWWGCVHRLALPCMHSLVYPLRVATDTWGHCRCRLHTVRCASNGSWDWVALSCRSLVSSPLVGGERWTRPLHAVALLGGTYRGVPSVSPPVSVRSVVLYPAEEQKKKGVGAGSLRAISWRRLAGVRVFRSRFVTLSQSARYLLWAGYISPHPAAQTCAS